ncbi:MAG TPA: DUF2058 family protein [Rudaea sp.]|jgi:uncharacterized protein YaiL (DUF2058 family)
MSDSLRDQLLKSGLVQKLKPESKTRPEPPVDRRQSRPQPPSKTPASALVPVAVRPDLHEHDLARAYALRAKQEKDERDRAQREAERVAREKKERKQKLNALLDGKALNAADADVPRHFPHGNKIRRIYCTPAQLVRLNKGDLAVVQLAGRYLLVEKDVALQAQTIQAESLVLLCDPNAPPEDDVPADLVW